MMDPSFVAVAGFVALFTLMLLRFPIGLAMGAVGVAGFAALVGVEPAMKLLAQSPIRTATDAGFAVIPLFLLMGTIASASGMSGELFQAANSFLGHRKGGLGMATIAACAGFAAISGSSVATAATFSAVAYPEMRRFNYPQSFSTGVIAAGGTLGAILPPSLVLAVYSLITQQDVGKLYMAGIIPGLLAVLMYVTTIWVIGRVRPGFLPRGPRAGWSERLAAVRGVWAITLLFLFVIGGMYGGAFTPTEAASMGAGGAFLIAVLRGRLSPAMFLDCLLRALRTSAAIFAILIGALLFGYFLTITQTPQHVTEFLTGLGLGRYHVLLLIMLMYLVLGCVMDAMAMVILTIPIIFPVITALGFDPIWFGVIIVMTVELGLIHPPVGMNVFVIKSVVRDVRIGTIFVGVIPFVITDIIRLAILIAFPILSTFLPEHM
ncbi:MAG: TRAP transporter large permease [Rhodospirillales bacterium]|nr:TRAP transporter large permease [Rhodospirillales bacterium]MDE2198876.1 TRAP transporter large permease [Rhodospirillales bacterium]MDE2574297.1 TRAP transporter large permease [Rhodospirillales bacterium]